MSPGTKGIGMDLSGALAVLGVIGPILSVLLLILNLKVSGAMAELKITVENSRVEFTTQLASTKSSVQAELKGVELQVANLRGDLYKEHAKIYEQVMDKSTAQYMNRDLSLEMHTTNLARFDKLDKRLDELTTRVGDIS